MQENWLDKLSALKQSMPEQPEQQQDITSEDTTETPAQSGRLDIVYERKGRAGKCATIITGFTIDDDSIEALASELKRRLGTGGSARGGEILVQGDRRQDVLAFLTGKGLKARII
ncbi:MAG: translation initiation factor [Muribaculaceae bacterium]|nr:translation initiation factor [Muribaculaceae bacterium]